MSATPARRFVHTRSISIRAFARDDGLWDLEAELADVKERDFALAVGIRAAGDPVHRMRLTLTIDTQLNVVDAEAISDRVPYSGHCDVFSEVYRPHDQAHEPDAADHVEQGKRPFQLDRCRGLRVDGAAVAKYYPRWYTGGSTGKEQGR